MSQSVVISYADGVRLVSFGAGMVRFDLFEFLPDVDAPTAGDDANEEAVVRNRLVMPIDGFLDAYAKMSNLVAQLEEAKLIQRSEDKEEQLSAPSPNFQ